MTSRTLMVRALAAATALTAIAAPASAQQVDRIVSFGDSYADTGNALYIIENNPLTPASTVTFLKTIYPQGRFSNSTNYIDSLSQILNAPVVNYAVGGATTGTYNNGFPGLPGLTQETAIFLSNTTPAGTNFPRAGGFKPGDLLALSIGGNDGRAFATNSASTVAGASAAAAVSVAQATANLNALVAAGAPTISYLALNSGGSPDFIGNTTYQQLGTAFSTAFNTGLQSTLAGYAAKGVTVHYLDGTTVLNNILANPSAYGITNTFCPAFNPYSVPTLACAFNASGYLFYGDGVHLTADGFRILAQYTAAQLEAPLTLQATSDNALDTANQWGRTLTTRLDTSAPHDGGEALGTHFYVVGDEVQRTSRQNEMHDQYRSSSVGATAGFDVGLGNATIGAAVNYSRPRASFNNHAFRAHGDTFQVGAYGAAGFAGGFIQGYAGYGWDKHKLTRTGVVSPMTASPKGNHLVAGAKAGYLLPLGIVRVGPVIGLDYARAKVDGYTEAGDAALTLNVDSVKVHSLRGDLGLELRGDSAPGGLKFRPYGGMFLEKDLAGDDRAIYYSQTDAPIIVNHWDVANSKKLYGRFTVGAAADLASAVSLNVSLSTTAGKPEGNESSAHLGFRFGF
ncbi:autotransporter domain-containing protein [Sphingomonas sp. ASV193]|uniref:autotransporter domain-containing protein n=1 Tax=Sphingomonas sp. ASV193 TaxID=3144405 RepID=UPI0032E8DCAF